MPKPRNKLLDRQRAVIDYYFGPAHFNRAKALEMAGYALPNKYWRFWEKPAVKAEIERRHAEIRAAYEVTYERTVSELARVAYSNVADFIEVDPVTGDFVIRLDRANAEQLRALGGEVTVEEYTDGKGENARPVKRMKFKPWNKVAALEALMRHAGLSKEKAPTIMVDLVDRINAGRARVASKEEPDANGS